MAPHSSTLAWKIPWTEEPGGLQSMGVAKSQTRLSDFTFTREGRDLGVVFQAPPGSQASSRGEAKDSAVLLSHDADLLEPSEWPKGSQASCGVWRQDSGWLSRPCRKGIELQLTCHILACREGSRLTSKWSGAFQNSKEGRPNAWQVSAPSPLHSDPVVRVWGSLNHLQCHSSIVLKNSI